MIPRINRLRHDLRLFMPRGTDLGDASQTWLNADLAQCRPGSMQTWLNDVARLMNGRPGKTLG